MEPLVSVITPAYNCERFLISSVKSVQNQTYNNWEQIIVDDHSTDNTRRIIEQLVSHDSRIRPLYLEANGGVANARNRGIAAARGKYVAFLDSDDLWMPEKLEKHVEYMERNNCGFTYSNYKLIDSDGNFLKNMVFKKRKINYRDLLDSNQIGCLTAVVRSEIIKREMMPDLKHEDYATWLNILRKHVEYAERLDGILAAYRKSNGSISSNKIKTIFWTWNIYRNNQNLGLFRAIKQLTVFGILTAIKYMKR